MDAQHVLRLRRVVMPLRVVVVVNACSALPLSVDSAVAASASADWPPVCAACCGVQGVSRGLSPCLALSPLSLGSLAEAMR